MTIRKESELVPDMWKYLLLIIVLVEVFDLSLDGVYHSSNTVLMENDRTMVAEYNSNTSG